jgi:hypothetical protein
MTLCHRKPSDCLSKQFAFHYEEVKLYYTPPIVPRVNPELFRSITHRLRHNILHLVAMRFARTTPDEYLVW